MKIIFLQFGSGRHLLYISHRVRSSGALANYPPRRPAAPQSIGANGDSTIAWLPYLLHRTHSYSALILMWMKFRIYRLLHSANFQPPQRMHYAFARLDHHHSPYMKLKTKMSCRDITLLMYFANNYLKRFIFIFILFLTFRSSRPMFKPCFFNSISISIAAEQRINKFIFIINKNCFKNSASEKVLHSETELLIWFDGGAGIGT